MNYNPILIVAGEPNSVFLEIYFKTITKLKIKSPLILIVSKRLLILQMMKLKFKKKINLLNHHELDFSKLDNRSINIINVDYNPQNAFEKISDKSNQYIENCFKVAIKILKKGYIQKFINGPISKKNYLGNKFLGITEYLAHHFKKKNAMLIYNKQLSVCPITTHLPLKFVSKFITKKIIIDKIDLINKFYKKQFNYKPKIALLGLNPHCESIHKYNEDNEILKPTVKVLSKLNYKISGPYPADTIFLKNNRKKFDVIVGMYHDQVLTPLKTLYEYNAINITLGLPFIRISPDHGPNERMMGKNLSNPLSLIQAIKFLDKN